MELLKRMIGQMGMINNKHVRQPNHGGMPEMRYGSGPRQNTGGPKHYGNRDGARSQGRPGGNMPGLGPKGPMMGGPAGPGPMMGGPAGPGPMMGGPAGPGPMMGGPAGPGPMMGGPAGPGPMM